MNEIETYEPTIPTTAVTTVTNLTTALSNVMNDIEPVRKAGKNTHFNYKFTKMEDLLTEVTPRLAKHGLLIMQSEISHEVKDNILYATYEFTLLHKSGEVWPDRPRMTGMCRFADNKGSPDDKAMNKAHTAARKYFLLALFQIPTEDDNDTDERPPVDQSDQRKISDRATPSRPAMPVFKQGDTPRRVDPAKGETPRSWADKYLAAIASSVEPEQVGMWHEANADLLRMLHDDAPNLRRRVDEEELTMKRKLSARRTVDTSRTQPMPPKGPPRSKLQADPEKFRGELDAIWSEIHDLKALDESWVQLVEPVQDNLLPPDLADLSKLWGDHALRIEGRDDD